MTGYLQEAVRLACKGRGGVEPNPTVGAVLVRDGAVIASGYHRRYGGPHAEIAVLRKAGGRTAGATLYVTLEPCSSHGKTPACTDAVIESGVRRVVVGAVDPDSRHSGAGLEVLRRAGLEVRLAEDESCEQLLTPFRRYLKDSRPHVIVKWAMTLDGRIAARDGSSQWISGEKSRRAVHRLRGHVDAVMVGSRTVVLDNPRLNCRLGSAPLVPRRVVLDPRLEIPLDAGLIQGAGFEEDEDCYPQGPVVLFFGPEADREKVEALEGAGVHLERLEGGAFLEHALVRMREMGIHRLLVEGGSQLFTSLVEARMADQVLAFIAAKIVGGEKAPTPVEGRGLAPMKNACHLTDTRITRFGDDVLMEGFFPWHASS